MLVKELRQEAKKVGIKNYQKLKKQELVEVLEEYRKKNSLTTFTFDIVLKNKETTLKYPMECASKEDAVKELHKLMRLETHRQYKELQILNDGKLILNITR